MTAPAKALPSTITVHVPFKFTIRGGRKTIIGQIPQPATHTRFDDSVTKALARAHRWRSRIEDGTFASIAVLAKAEKINESYVCRILRLTLLAPDIVEAALNQRGTNFTVEAMTQPLPAIWDEQRSRLQIS